VTKKLRTVITHVGSFVLAGGLLYLALRGVDFAEMGEALRTAAWIWIVPMLIITILSHVLRAWRWKILLDEIPTDGLPADATPTTIPSVFGALMIGYMSNYAAPRVGEVVRSAVIKRTHHLPLASVIGTVVVERVIDVVLLGVTVVTVLVILADRLNVINELFVEPWANQEGAGITGILVLVGLIAIGLTTFVLVRRHRRADVHGESRLSRALASFSDGLKTLTRTRQRGALIWSSVLMLVAYTIMAYLPFVMFGMTDAYGISIIDAYVIMIVGAVGVAIPSPGGIGSYHYVTIQVMVHLYGIDASHAATYAVFSHGGQLVLYTFIGFVALLKMGIGVRGLRTEKGEADRATQEGVAAKSLA